MVRFFSTIAIFLICTVIGSSCITMSEKRAMQDEMASLQAQLEVLRKRLEEEQTQGPTEGQLGMAELNTAYEDVRSEVEKTNSEIKANRYFFEEEKKSAEKLLKDLDLRIQGMEGQLDHLKKRRDGMAKKKGPPQKKSTQKSDKELYDGALSLIQKDGKKKPNKKDYQSATNLLKELIKNYPKSTYVANAYYWMGEIYYVQGDFKRAFLEFEKVGKHDSKHTKAPGALLKQGYCFVELKNTDSAKVFFHSVIKQYPKSQEAKLAKEKLASFEKGKGQAQAPVKKPKTPKKKANKPLEDENLNPVPLAPKSP